ncbi:MAG: hypothetical protein AAGF23_19670 [Acidobacteriota bacterium]
MRFRKLPARLDDIAAVLAARGDAVALIGLGSVGRGLERLTSTRTSTFSSSSTRAPSVVATRPGPFDLFPPSIRTGVSAGRGAAGSGSELWP